MTKTDYVSGIAGRRVTVSNASEFVEGLEDWYMKTYGVRYDVRGQTETIVSTSRVLIEEREEDFVTVAGAVRRARELTRDPSVVGKPIIEDREAA